MKFFQTNVKDDTKEWAGFGHYQNTTLRHCPGEDFPAHLEKIIRRPKIIRCFLTMDDAWDYRTGEYRYDFVIGEDPYVDDPKMFRYERYDQKMAPYGTTFERYLASHASCAEYVLLAVRRYEREVANGTISIDQYEEVLEHLLEHYKELVPNLRYIEGNEWNLSIFGGLTAFESYELYKRMYQVANRLNRKHQYEIPLEVGGPAYGVCLAEFKYYEEFLRLYKLDKNPEKMLAFYSTHDYKKNMTELPGYYYKHQELVRELGLPNSPIFFDEYGAAELFTPEISDNQMNAAVSIEMLLTVAWLENFYVFPWCTYHDPSLQVSHCMFVDFNRTCGYLPTFYGQAHIALSKLLGNVLPMTGNTGNRAVVTTDGENYVILATNPDDKPHNIRFALTNLPGTTVKVEAYKVDAMHNNCFIDKSVTDLQITDSWEASLEDGKLMVYDTLDALGFTLWIIKK